MKTKSIVIDPQRKEKAEKFLMQFDPEELRAWIASQTAMIAEAVYSGGSLVANQVGWDLPDQKETETDEEYQERVGRAIKSLEAKTLATLMSSTKGAIALFIADVMDNRLFLWDEEGEPEESNSTRTYAAVVAEWLDRHGLLDGLGKSKTSKLICLFGKVIPQLKRFGYEVTREAVAMCGLGDEVEIPKIAQIAASLDGRFEREGRKWTPEIAGVVAKHLKGPSHHEKFIKDLEDLGVKNTFAPTIEHDGKVKITAEGGTVTLEGVMNPWQASHVTNIVKGALKSGAAKLKIVVDFSDPHEMNKALDEFENIGFNLRHET